MSINISQRLEKIVARSAPLLNAYPIEKATQAIAPGKWSRIQLLGHLVDSASNNHQRFVRAQIQDNLVFVGYTQDQWVSLQDYQNADWPELVRFWESYNLHLARIIERIPIAVSEKAHLEHSLDRIAFRTIPQGEPASLAYFMMDYIDHLVHHLKQILGEQFAE
ncbi:MAG: DinB family protein [Bacteroidota bacterium]